MPTNIEVLKAEIERLKFKASEDTVSSSTASERVIAAYRCALATERFELCDYLLRFLADLPPKHDKLAELETRIAELRNIYEVGGRDQHPDIEPKFFDGHEAACETILRFISELNERGGEDASE